MVCVQRQVNMSQEKSWFISTLAFVVIDLLIETLIIHEQKRFQSGKPSNFQKWQCVQLYGYVSMI